jgi:hypothetical protein
MMSQAELKKTRIRTMYMSVILIGSFCLGVYLSGVVYITFDKRHEHEGSMFTKQFTKEEVEKTTEDLKFQWENRYRCKYCIFIRLLQC